ncbi:major allergen I polypeptide chain 2 [Oryctolagus cuniculus]|uniref:major allergen I polypeptide chain 2 n=1 Tax=Oryctolagus cuniculus TaxID=9986 RepID=UPI00222F2EA3|nr:major allergen I polypeptide chain 2 [Oryctolagus cuniculus]
MKGTLLVLALLVSGELGLQLGESAVGCPIFYKIFGTLPIGDRNLLNAALDLVHANESEKEALGKVQDCYNEGGLAAKALDLRVMSSITGSKECKLHLLQTAKEEVIKALPIPVAPANALGR